MSRSTFAAADGGGVIILPLPVTLRQQGDLQHPLSVNTVFLPIGEDGAPWTGYYTIFRGVKRAIENYQAPVNLALVHEPYSHMNLDELKTQTAREENIESNIATPIPTGFASAPQTPAHHEAPHASRPPSTTSEYVPTGFNIGRSEPSRSKGKYEDEHTPPSQRVTITGTPGGGDPDSDFDAGEAREERRMREVLKAIRGDRLEGATPEPFRGDRGDTRRFLLAFDCYCFMNHDAAMIKDPMKRSALFLGLCHGKAMNWANSASTWLKDVRDGRLGERPPFGYDVWQITEREFRDTFTDYADSDRAHQDLLKLRMKDGRLDEYVDEFQDLADRAGIDVNEPNALRMFAQGLQGTLATTCIYQNNPDNFPQWVQSAQTNHRNWLKVQALKEHNPFQQQRRPGQSPFTRRWINGQQQHPARRDPNAMDVDVIHKATTEDEKQKYRSEGRCYNCGKQGHLSRNCPDRKPRTATTATDTTPRIAVASATPTPQTTATIDNDFIRKMTEISMRMTLEQQDLLARSASDQKCEGKADMLMRSTRRNSTGSPFQVAGLGRSDEGVVA